MIEIKELAEETNEQEQFNPFQFVTIPVTEYRKMIRKIEKLKAEVKIQKAESDRDGYRDRAWTAEANLKEAKAQIQKLLGVEGEEDAE